jgi:hypothetical protein
MADKLLSLIASVMLVDETDELAQLHSVHAVRTILAGRGISQQ